MSFDKPMGDEDEEEGEEKEESWSCMLSLVSSPLSMMTRENCIDETRCVRESTLLLRWYSGMDGSVSVLMCSPERM